MVVNADTEIEIKSPEKCMWPKALQVSEFSFSIWSVFVWWKKLSQNKKAYDFSIQCVRRAGLLSVNLVRLRWQKWLTEWVDITAPRSRKLSPLSLSLSRPLLCVRPILRGFVNIKNCFWFTLNHCNQNVSFINSCPLSLTRSLQHSDNDASDGNKRWGREVFIIIIINSRFVLLSCKMAGEHVISSRSWTANCSICRPRKTQTHTPNTNWVKREREKQLWYSYKKLLLISDHIHL